MRVWNIHTIRKQPRRPTVISGIPHILYHYPLQDVENYGLSLNEELLSKT